MQEDIIEQIASLITSREHYQRMLGQIALEYRQTHGGTIECLKELASEVKERHGLSISWNTLHNYSWVEDRLKDLEIPEDISFRIRQVIAGTDNPSEWVKKINEGATTREIYEGIKGKQPRPLVECPKCHFAFERPSSNDAYERAKEATKDFKY